MQVQVDTREHAKEWERIKGQFDALGVQYFRSKMYVGVSVFGQSETGN